MQIISGRPAALALSAILALPGWSAVSAQQDNPSDYQDPINVHGALPADLSELAEGPEIEGYISARDGDQMQVTSAEGSSTIVRIADATRIKARGGFLGLNRTQLAADALLNGLPVTVETVQWGGGLLADRIRFKDDDFETAAMISRGTAQGFAEQTAATEALRGRVGDIDQYNIRGTTNVYFDTGKWSLSPEAQYRLCSAAAQADSMDNALILVVGYTDSVGSQEYNQVLSERRAGRVVNFLQQECGWAPYRMLTPTGMAEADPLVDSEDPASLAQNRRVAVNIHVSKSVDGMNSGL